MKRFVAALVLFLTGNLLACDLPPEFAVPLPEPSNVEPDNRLFGDWYIGSDVDWYVRVEHKHRSDPPEVLMIYPRTESGGPIWFRMQAFPSVIDGLTFYNLKRIEWSGLLYKTTGETPGYIIVMPILLDDDFLLVCVLHGEEWGNSGARRMFETAGIPYREVESAEPPDGYLLAEMTEANMQNLVQAGKHLSMFRSFVSLTRIGHKLDEHLEAFPGLEKYLEDHGCPFQGWPPKE